MAIGQAGRNGESTRRLPDPGAVSHTYNSGCRRCGDPVPITRRGKFGRPAVYCSPGCRPSHASRRGAYLARYRAARRVTYEHTCRVCGLVFTTGRRRQVRCQEHVGRVGYSSVLNQRQKRAVAERDEWRCYLCGFAVDPELRWPDDLAASVDHVVPVSRGGSHRMANLRLTHWRCNRDKADGDAPWWVS